MLPAGPLMIEHRLIERMVSAMDREMQSIEQGKEPDAPFLLVAVDFMRSYADRCHHGKEEDILFAKMATKPLPPPMRQAMERLIGEHALSRSLISRLKEQTDRYQGGDAVARDISGTLAEIVRLYPDHIAREDKEFFPAAMTYLDRDESDDMLRRYAEFDRRLFHDKYKAVVEGVEKR